MLNEVVFASKNKHKVEEIRHMFSHAVERIVELPSDYEDIVEDGKSFHENAFIKALNVFKNMGKVALADDSGLCIDALGGKPGIFSARYAGEGASQKEQIDKILGEMAHIKDIADRKAYFTTSAVLILSKDVLIHTEGFVHGYICHEPKGDNGFGYDPIFVADGYTQTFAELSSEEKNRASHRYIAMSKLNIIMLNLSSYSGFNIC